MNFYILHDNPEHGLATEHQVYVNREDFDEAVAETVDQAQHGCDADERDEVERRIRDRTATHTSLTELENELQGQPDHKRQWTEAGRRHDGTADGWRDSEYRIGNSCLYRLTAASLKTAEDETMGYDQTAFHDMGFAKALSVDNVAPEQRTVTEKMASTIQPCETAACVAGHAYVSAFGWRRYLQTAIRSNDGEMTWEIGRQVAAELGMSSYQEITLFCSHPSLEEINEAFGLKAEDWACPTAQINAIEEHWHWNATHAGDTGAEPSPHRANDMRVVLEAIARRCDRVNAFVAGIEN